MRRDFENRAIACMPIEGGHMKPILVTGAAGTVGGTGRHLAELLLKRGAPVRAMVRQEDERSLKLAKAGAEIVKADFLDEDAVRNAMQGVDVAYFCPPVFEVLLHATTVFALCARESLVQRVINLSQWGTGDPILSPATRLHRLGEMIFDWSGTPTSHLLPAMFMEQLSLVFGPGVRAQSALIAPFNDKKVSMIAAYDVSRVAAAIALEPERFATGPYISQARPISRCSRSQTPSPTYSARRSSMSISIRRSGKRAGWSRGAPPHLANHLEKLYEKGRLGRLNYGPTSVVEEVTGAPPTSLKEFFASTSKTKARVLIAKRGMTN